MGKVTNHLLTLIAKQVEDRGIVVWYDPERAYTKVIEKLAVPDTTVLSFEDSFLRLREQIEPFLEFVDDDGKPKPDCWVPPKLIVYIPKGRSDTHYALVEIEMAGVVLEPGAHPWQRNTRLRVMVTFGDVLDKLDLSVNLGTSLVLHFLSNPFRAGS